MSDKKENMMYICGKCAHEVERDAKVCPFCHANLNNIRCPYCGFIGAPEKFKNDHCPRCGKSKNISIDYNPANSKKNNSVNDEIQIKGGEAKEYKTAKKNSKFSEWLNRFFFPLLFILVGLFFLFGYLLLY
ncbi:MAG: zinc ribbon domain-containing protein [Spirochaetales bacterium]|nr:zinc ribbon domain-containing protein [Spirochaetales bacterium]